MYADCLDGAKDSKLQLHLVIPMGEQCPKLVPPCEHPDRSFWNEYRPVTYQGPTIGHLHTYSTVVSLPTHVASIYRNIGAISCTSACGDHPNFDS
ncbi:hypothetical protein EYC84_011877 [Monilinia fructicola]|uniref:Uncharacterized protein n=1 Tax=Monilinia fructicola TaxID=38448 RepID=A0A5M9J7Q7_MONFR|nr:hypothetical protein EYC84_011877 [Monilinia fructicola]